MDALIEQRGIIGVGYEGEDIDKFISKLKVAEVNTLADIRLTPISRKRGFSKRLLAASLAEAGIKYLHMPELGNPKWNREGFGGSLPEVLAARERFANMIDDEAASKRLGEIAEEAGKGVVAVMCFEADERACHRFVVLSRLQRPLALCDLPA